MPTSTAVILDGTTTAGSIQDGGFSYTSDQPITGLVRKGTTAPLYKTAAISGTINEDGLDATVFMIGDE